MAELVAQAVATAVAPLVEEIRALREEEGKARGGDRRVEGKGARNPRGKGAA